MGDIQQILQTSWPILLMVVIFTFIVASTKETTKRAR